MFCSDFRKKLASYFLGYLESKSVKILQYRYLFYGAVPTVLTNLEILLFLDFRFLKVIPVHLFVDNFLQKLAQVLLNSDQLEYKYSITEIFLTMRLTMYRYSI